MTTPMTPSQSFETGSLPRSVQFFKKSVKEQTQSNTLPSKIILKNPNKPIKSDNNGRYDSSATANKLF